MRIETLAQNGACDAMFLAPHLRDVPLSCAHRLHWLLSQGKRVLVILAFGHATPESPWLELFARWGVDWFELGLPAAGDRDPAYRRLSVAAFEERPGDEAALLSLTSTLEDLLRISRPSALYLPLAVGGHVDHRLAHAAGIRSARLIEGANVYLYEERPSALLPGAVRLRMGQVGARLPPGGEVPARANLPLSWWRFQSAPYSACVSASHAERLRASGRFARAWRQVRDWRPQRALGIRLQPVVHDYTDGPGAEAAEQILGRLAHEGEGQRWSLPRLRALGQRYERSLSTAERAERYWLLLPDTH
jgi:LmbE family N-acetylglucosaminyl deacetylase